MSSGKNHRLLLVKSTGRFDQNILGVTLNEETKKTSLVKKAGIGCGVVLVAIIGIGMLGNAMMSDEDRARYAAEREAKEAAEADAEREAAESAAQAKIDGAVKLTAAELWNAYNNNEVAAQRAFNDRDLLVSGTVASIELDFADDPVVRFVSPNQYMQVSASFDETYEDRAAALSRGQALTVMCSRVSEIAGTPMLRDCTIPSESGELAE